MQLNELIDPIGHPQVKVVVLVEIHVPSPHRFPIKQPSILFGFIIL